MLSLQDNGSAYKLNIDPEPTLLWVLCDHLGLTGTKYSCGIAFRAIEYIRTSA